jgi:16S rRNA (cytidine1402-2'-O)-methyltransferase
MSLTLVATPIGNEKDISDRAIHVLNSAEIIFVESFRQGTTLLKRLGIHGKTIYELNEHSRASDLEELTELCVSKNVALISDGGTPNFYDPGALLIHGCRKLNVSITSVPGANTLTTLLSLTSVPILNFYFAGFLPAESQARAKAWKDLQSMKCTIILMDTPYRLKKLLEEASRHFQNRKAILGCDLTLPSELVLEGSLDAIKSRAPDKAEFCLLIYNAG